MTATDLLSRDLNLDPDFSKAVAMSERNKTNLLQNTDLEIIGVPPTIIGNVSPGENDITEARPIMSIKVTLVLASVQNILISFIFFSMANVDVIFPSISSLHSPLV